MRRVFIAIAALGVLTVCTSVVSQSLFADESAAKADASNAKAEASAGTVEAAVPADRVVVMYFHRTQRCPTCLRMGSYSEEAVVKGFAKQIKKGTVEFHYVDFQDEKNSDLTNGYKVAGPTLIVAQVVGNKVKEYKNLTEIWAKNGDKDEFLKYVRDKVTTYQADDAAKADTPADRVVVMYFHRTQRCPTCLRMGSYSEEAVVQGFARQIKKGTVEFHYIDFQDEKNAELTNSYKVSGPTLIVTQVVGNKVKEYKNLTEIWTKNRSKDGFLKYVRDNVAAYQKPESKTAMKQETEGAAQSAN